MPENICKLDRGAATPTVEINVGYAHQCRFKLRQYDEDGGNKVVLEDGVNTDNTPDQYMFTESVADLDKKQLFWSLLLISLSGPLNAYQATVTVRQGQTTCPGGAFTYSGESDNRLHEEADGVRFVVI